MRISDCSSDVCSSDLIDSAAVMHRVKYQSELCRTLAHVLVDHAIKQDCEERHGELAGNCCRGHSLSCPRGAGEEETLTRGEAMRFECGCFPLRSEEHTSELQSLMRISYAVFCLKKKKK